jgi:hypothetical protein
VSLLLAGPFSCLALHPPPPRPGLGTCLLTDGMRDPLLIPSGPLSYPGSHGGEFLNSHFHQDTSDQVSINLEKKVEVVTSVGSCALCGWHCSEWALHLGSIHV